MLLCLNLKLKPTLLLLFGLVDALLFQLAFADDAKAWQNLVWPLPTSPAMVFINF